MPEFLIEGFITILKMIVCGFLLGATLKLTDFIIKLFRYSHPFILPNLITKKLTKHEVEVQFKVIQVFSSVNIAKTFWIKDFLEDYSVKLTNQQKPKMKNYLFINRLKKYCF